MPFCVWLLLVNILFVKFIHVVVVCSSGRFIFSVINYSSVEIYRGLSVLPPLMYVWVISIFLGISNIAVMNTPVNGFQWMAFSEHIRICSPAGSSAICMLSVSGYCQVPQVIIAISMHTCNNRMWVPHNLAKIWNYQFILF